LLSIRSDDNELLEEDSNTTAAQKLSSKIPNMVPPLQPAAPSTNGMPARRYHGVDLSIKVFVQKTMYQLT